MIDQKVLKMLDLCEKDGDRFYVKKGYMIAVDCDDDFLTVIFKEDDGKWRGYSMASDNRYILEGRLLEGANLYQLEKIA